MKKIIFLLSMFLLILNSCISENGQETARMSTETIKPVITENEVVDSTVESNITEVPPSTVAPSLQPTTEQNGTNSTSNDCLKYPIIPFEELRLHPDYGLLVIPGDSRDNPSKPITPSLFFSQNPDPVSSFPDIVDGRWYGSRVSPDHRWIYFYRTSDDDNQKSVWVSSVIGQDAWQVIEIDKKNSVHWTSNEEIVIVGRPDAEDYDELELWDYFPFVSINPFTLEQKELKYLGDEGIFSQVFNSDGNLYSFYLTSDYYRIYDYNKETDLIIFNWIKPSLNRKLVWVYHNDKLASIIRQDRKVDISIGLEIDTANDSELFRDVTKTFSIPEYFYPATAIGISPIENHVIFISSDEAVRPHWLFVVDYQTMSIKDVCFDLENSYLNLRFSPDGRFMAMSHERENPSVAQSRYYLTIIDLESGNKAFLEGYYVLDWILASNSE